MASIEGSRITLIPFTEDFITDRYLSWLNNPKVVRYSRQRSTRHTKETALRFLETTKKSDSYFWAVLNAKTGDHIGNVSVTMDRPNSVADIAIMIGEHSIWGQGYDLEAWSLVLHHLHKEGIRLVTGGCMATNTAMIRVMEKSGMRPYFTRAGYFLDQGRPVDSVHYASGGIPALSEADWEDLPHYLRA